MTLALIYDYETQPIEQPIPSPYPAKDIHMVSSIWLDGKPPKTKLFVNDSMPTHSKKNCIHRWHKSIVKKKPKYVIAHNIVSFDNNIMLGSIGGKLPKGTKMIDTLILSRRLFTEYPSHRLGYLGSLLGFPKDDYKNKAKADMREANLTYDYDGKEFERQQIVRSFKHASRYCINDTNLLAKVLLKQINRLMKLDLEYVSQITEVHLDTCYKYSKLEITAQKMLYKSQYHGYPLDDVALKKAADEIHDGKETVYKELQVEANAGFERTEPITPTRCSSDKYGNRFYNWIYKPATKTAIKKGLYHKVEHSDGTVSRIALDKDGNRTDVKVKDPDTFFNPYCKLIWKPFNPGSNIQVADILLKRGWKPIRLTDSGKPGTGVKDLKPVADLIPIAKSIIEYNVLSKQYSSVEGGDKSLLTKYNPVTKRIHHLNQVAGASSSSRSSHTPNVSQVTRVKTDDDGNMVFGRKSKWGTDMRYAFKPYPGHVQVGCDISGLELRTLAEMMVPFDKGALMKHVMEGDIHQRNTDTILKSLKKWSKGLPKKVRKRFRADLAKYDRDSSKKTLYTFMYGGGNLKMGHDAFPWMDEKDKMSAGKDMRESLFASMKGLKQLIAYHARTVKAGQYVQIFDGSVYSCKDEYLILSRINQSAGARVCLNWVVNSYFDVAKYCKRHGLKMWKDIGLLGYFHDEMQWSIVPEHADALGKILTKSAKKTGKKLDFTVPIGAEFKIGKNWAECH